MHIPSSTYRIQLHQDFTFKDLQRVLEYLNTLGITTIYAAPITQATPGSMHGYDVTDPHTINTALGTIDDLKTIGRDLKKKDMFWLQDIVPNHMAFHTMNFRLMDVLERGPRSPYYLYFDIQWNHHVPALNGKIMVPFLGKELGECVDQGEIKLAFSDKGLAMRYFDTQYPLSLSAYSDLLAVLVATDKESTLPALVGNLLQAENESYERWQSTKEEFLAQVLHDSAHNKMMEAVVDKINNDRRALEELINHQYYLPSYWKHTDRQINYRRFFTVNELICLRMEDKKVFDEYHTYLLKLYKEKLVHGFRIDHIDGLKDPGKYTQNLRNLMGESCYLIAEKILEAKEDMPTHWPLQGTSGYEFLSFLNQLLTHRKGSKELVKFYHELIPEMPAYRKLIFDSKKLILENYMMGEWDNLSQLFSELQLLDKFDINRIKQALGYFMLSLPVYRIYPETLPVRGKSLLIIHEAFEKALAAGAGYDDELNHLQKLFTLPPSDDDEHARILDFLKRLMQFTGPLTAKGVEDTTFYIYNPLISHDEVGDTPSSLGMTIQRFHDIMQQRQSSTPLSLNATATHDTKRGEDSRVRLNVLSRIPAAWKEHVIRWLEINKTFRKTIDGKSVPQLNDEYFIYQSMVGGFPEDFEVTDEWVKRLQAFLNKALREAKVHTNWSDPDEQYEKACEQFIEQILHKEHSFLRSFIPFVRNVFEHAMVYSLSQTLIKLTAPGIPDIYQGCELWDLSFVDPDNRRPVDYEKRIELLWQLVVKEEKGKDALFEFLAEHRRTGIEKLYVTWKTLNLRKLRPQLFIEGDYIPLAITGEEITAAAFARHKKNEWVLAIIPLGLVTHDDLPEDKRGVDQFVVLPEEAPQEWTDIFTGQSFELANQISLQKIFRRFPVALLISDQAETPLV